MSDIKFAYSAEWCVSESRSPYTWGIVTTAEHCQHRKEGKCIVPVGDVSGECRMEICPLRCGNFPELFEPEASK